MLSITKGNGAEGDDPRKRTCVIGGGMLRAEVGLGASFQTIRWSSLCVGYPAPTIAGQSFLSAIVLSVIE